MLTHIWGTMCVCVRKRYRLECHNLSNLGVMHYNKWDCKLEKCRSRMRTRCLFFFFYPLTSFPVLHTSRSVLFRLWASVCVCGKTSLCYRGWCTYSKSIQYTWLVAFFSIKCDNGIFLNILNWRHCLWCFLSSVLSWRLFFSPPSSAPWQLCVTLSPSVKTVSLGRSSRSLTFSLPTPALFLSLCLSCWGLCRRTVSFSACSPPASCCCEPHKSQTEVKSVFLCARVQQRRRSVCLHVLCLSSLSVLRCTACGCMVCLFFCFLQLLF